MITEQYAPRGRPKQVRTVCPHCHGSGKDIIKIPGKTKPTDKPCPVCHGKGFLVKASSGEQNESSRFDKEDRGRKSSSASNAVKKHLEFRKKQAAFIAKHNPPKNQVKEDEAPVNNIGSGHVSTFDPILGRKRLDSIKRKLKKQGKFLDRRKQFVAQMEFRKRAMGGRSAA